jgi:hypothetical protein
LKVLVLAVTLLLAAPSISGAPATPQSPIVNPKSQLPAAGSIQLTPRRLLRKGVDAWPLIASPTTPPEQHINAILTRLNARLANSLKDCDEGARGQMGPDYKGKDPAADDWSRTIAVTMTGPRFLSLIATEEVFCGGTHPDGDTMAMVFDLTTGAPVNWVAMVAKSATPSAFSDSVSDGSTMGALILPDLAKMNLAGADADCKDAFQDPQSFQLWPDAQLDRLVAQPFDLPHVVQACANEIALTLDEARKLGFDEGLLGAIAQAHRQAAPILHK